MIRTPLRPLARVLQARARGENPDGIERENLRLRAEHARDTARERAEVRLLVAALLFLGGFVLIGAQMALLAATDPIPPRSAQSDGIAADRAEIVDRRGRVLATNLVTHSLYAETRHMVDPVRAAHALAAIFPDIDGDRLERQFTDPDRRFVWVRGRLSPEQRQAVHDIGEPGLMFGPRDMRLYPNGTLAAHVLGGTRYGAQGVRAAEIVGVAGAELFFDERLRDPARRDMPLELSLDLTVQAVMTDVLGSGMRMLSARGASAVLMEANTGEIVSLVSLPDFDPNHRPPPATEGDPADSVLFNRAVQGYYELGSVLKVFTVAQALEEGVVTPDTKLDTRSPMQVGRFRISDFRSRGPEQSVSDVLAFSSNVGTARLARDLGPEAQQDFLRKLGFLDSVEVELAEAARARPLLPDRWGDLSAMTISYGHGLSTSPLQLAVGYAALVNGGRLVAPTLERRRGAVPSERVISETTSRQMRQMLHDVVQRGTASFARIPGYPVGGKTGSADKPKRSGGGYYDGKVLATFAAAFPIHDPRYVLVVTLDEPVDTTGPEPRRTAGWTAVPVSGEIIRRIAPLLGLAPESDVAIAQGLGAGLPASE